MRALALIALVLALPARAEDAEDRLAVKTADILSTSGTERKVAGGCWLSENLCINTGQALTDLQAENASLKAQAGSNILPALLVAALVGLAVGVGGTLVAVRLGK